MKLLISEYNPVKFYEYYLSLDSKYNTRFMDVVSVEDAILSFQDKKEWVQPWQKSDTIKIQLQSDSVGVRLCLIDCKEIEHFSASFVEKISNWKEDDLGLYEAELSLETIDEGYYHLAIKDEDEIYLISDRILVKETWDNSIYLQYHHRKNKGDLAFDTGISFNLRVLSVLQDFQPSSDDTVYLDQYRNTTVLSSTPFRIYKMIIGNAYGVPDYIADKVNRIFGLSNVLLDGNLFAKVDGAKMERNGERIYPFAGWSIDVIEAINKDATLFDVNPLNRPNVVIGNNVEPYISDEMMIN